ncbi:MAG: helix-hairpin-helix domain-containing protein [Gammaproteobacteria bacterium]|nr:helix-hairpin-helix domain-containing protein [Gammaproteobacteria bacterium]
MKLTRTILASIFFAVFSFTTYAEPVDINSADAEALAEAIKGVGPKTAAAIVGYRDQHGPFQSVDELQDIKGIGPKVVESNRENMKVSGAKTADTN